MSCLLLVRFTRGCENAIDLVVYVQFVCRYRWGELLHQPFPVVGFVETEAEHVRLVPHLVGRRRGTLVAEGECVAGEERGCQES